MRRRRSAFMSVGSSRATPGRLSTATAAVVSSSYVVAEGVSLIVEVLHRHVDPSGRQAGLQGNLLLEPGAQLLGDLEDGDARRHGDVDAEVHHGRTAGLLRGLLELNVAVPGTNPGHPVGRPPDDIEHGLLADRQAGRRPVKGMHKGYGPTATDLDMDELHD